ERLIDAECVFVCERDGDCGDGQRCNLFTGACEAKPPPVDAGVLAFPCTNGAERCAADNKSLEKCSPGGVWSVSQTCPPPSGFCLNEKCLTCQPGSASCDPADSRVAKICLEDGSGFRTINCSGVGVCNQGECRECTPGTTRCTVDGKNVQVCKHTADETLSWAWVNEGDAFDATCITQVCEGSPARCRPPACFPGTTQCKNITTQQVCTDLGGWGDVACASLPGYGPAAECQNGVCFDECADAVKAKSYFGCEYWSAVQDNGVDKFFKKMPLSTSPAQGTTDSSFAFVVSNRSTSPATVEVYRWFNNAEQKLKTVTVPGRNDVTKGLMTIKVPWQSVGPTDLAPATNPNVSTTGQKRYGYRLVSTRPMTVYQFSPLDAVQITKTCSSDTNCDEQDPGACWLFDTSGCGVCNQTTGGKKCHYYTYSNDASLLLPVHILGTSYVAVTNEHSNVFNGAGTIAKEQLSGHITIVAPQDATSVTIKSSAFTTASPAGYAPSIAAMTKGESRTFVLNRYDVLQLASAPLGTQLECTSMAPDKLCRLDNDLTGTVVTSDKPVALFGGAACVLKPYATPACDHLEEQIFPFATWGKKFVGQKSHVVRLQSGAFATAANAAPDYWKVVAGCPLSQCPNGTTITFSAGTTLTALLPNRCLGGTSLAANNCRLAGGTAMEFSSKVSFTITADYPIAVAQFFAGQSATTSTILDPVDTGDPSLVLLPPAEQWRSNYTVLAAPGIKDNYLGLSIDNTKVLRVEVDGVAVTGFTAIGGTPYVVKNHPISVGTHTVNVVPRSGVSPLPGAGLTIYGFDSYVSYGYTGGLDLGTIVTGINPGG
ncbi:MAG: IgGFc-binding protein, partial [Myxococcaceae bacterium]